jgi:hypothetical protein
LVKQVVRSAAVAQLQHVQAFAPHAVFCAGVFQVQHPGGSDLTSQKCV